MTRNPVLNKPLLGTIYSLGESTGITITEVKQSVVLQGVKLDVFVRVSSGELQLSTAEESHSTRDDAIREAHLNRENLITHRNAEINELKREADVITRKLEGADIDDEEVTQLEEQAHEKRALIRNHARKLKVLNNKTTMSVAYEVWTTTSKCVLLPGLYFRSSFLPKPVCWCLQDGPANLSVIKEDSERKTIVETVALLKGRKIDVKVEHCAPNPNVVLGLLGFLVVLVTC